MKRNTERVGKQVIGHFQRARRHASRSPLGLRNGLSRWYEAASDRLILFLQGALWKWAGDPSNPEVTDSAANEIDPKPPSDWLDRLPPHPCQSMEPLFQRVGEKAFGQLSCVECGKRFACPASRLIVYIHAGWSQCCGQAMTLDIRGDQ